jgi:hypothetical protein
MPVIDLRTRAGRRLKLSRKRRAALLTAFLQMPPEQRTLRRARFQAGPENECSYASIRRYAAEGCWHELASRFDASELTLEACLASIAPEPAKPDPVPASRIGHKPMSWFGTHMRARQAQAQQH